MKRLSIIVSVALALAICGPVMVMAETGLSVEDAVVASGIENLVPIGAGDSFSASEGSLICYSKIIGGSEGTSVMHNWYYNDKLMAAVRLAATYPAHRTYSSKRILPSWTGAWKVDIVDEDGMVLKTVEFTVTE